LSEGLNHWAFVIAAYAITVGGTALLVAASWLAMRRAEARRERARGE
jgi:nitrate reductase gamma subunit